MAPSPSIMQVVSGAGDHWIFHENPRFVNQAMAGEDLTATLRHHPMTTKPWLVIDAWAPPPPPPRPTPW
jgi:hypothetical protein